MRTQFLARLFLLLPVAFLLPTVHAQAEIPLKRLASQGEIESGFRAVAANNEVIALAGEKIILIQSASAAPESTITVLGSTARLFTDVLAYQGRFFALGLAESVTTLGSSLPLNLINPDSITISTSLTQSRGMTRLLLLEFSPSGVIIKESILDADAPLLPQSFRIIGDQIGIVGTIASRTGVQGFLAISDLSGNYRSFSRFGEGATEINTLANLRTLYGSSSERLAGTSRQGVSDGVILYLDSAGKLSRTVRSFLASSERSWHEVSSSHLAVGSVKRSTGDEIAITKFSAQGSPQWFVRYPGRYPHLNERIVGFVTVKKVTGIASSAVGGENAIFIEYEGRGLAKKASVRSVRSIPARSITDLNDGYAIIVDRNGRSQLIPLAP